jgi:hypothetical protein
MMEDYKEFVHMEAVFMPIDRDKPNLPFSEFITESGRHNISVSGDNYQHHFFAKYSIPRRDGAVVEVSVISGAMFYCERDAPYEVMVNGTGDPTGYMTDEQLMILLAKLISGESPYDGR